MKKRAKASEDFDFELPPETPEERRLRSQENRRAAARAVVEAGRKPPLPKGTHAEAFESVGVEVICARVEAGESLTAICEDISEQAGIPVDMGAMHRWMNSDDQRSARYLAARKASASSFDQLALNTLRDAPSDKVEIMRAREIASHMRWMAKTRDPRQYGDKLEVDQKSTVTHNMGEVDAQILLLLEKLTGTA